MIKDLAGQRFGRLIVLETFRENNITYCKCRCDCGNEKIVQNNNLKNGHVKSCGCLRKESPNHKTHSLSNSRLYNVWLGMKARCYYSKNNRYYCYGARGIQVCNEWKNDFMSFYEWSMSNGYNENAPRGKCTIDRIDINGNYEPNNCRWITNKEQANNTRKNHFVTYNNETHTLKEWSEILNINYGTLRNRITTCKWDYIKSLTTPIKKRKCK